jgi:hypothetical protein
MPNSSDFSGGFAGSAIDGSGGGGMGGLTGVEKSGGGIVAGTAAAWVASGTTGKPR